MGLQLAVYRIRDAEESGGSSRCRYSTSAQRGQHFEDVNPVALLRFSIRFTYLLRNLTNS